MVRRGYAAAFSTEGGVVIVAERASGTAAPTRQPRSRPSERPSPPAWARRSDVRFVPAGALPRTTSGKLARVACRSAYLRGDFGGR